MDNQYQKLLEPYQLKHLKLKNRMVKAPYSSTTADKDGFVTDVGIYHYEAIARGGVGLFITESNAIDILGLSGIPRLCIYDDKFIPGLSKLVYVIHKHDCPAICQIHHAGPAHSLGAYGGEAYEAATAVQPVGPSTLTPEQLPEARPNPPKGLAIPEIQAIVQKFIRACERVREAGFDGVELHFASAYLIDSFLSRAWNKRQDEYGGDAKKRARFAVEITRGVRQRLGDNFVVGVRMNAAEYGTPEGITFAESQVTAKLLEEAGADYIHSTGWGYGNYHLLVYPEQILYPEPAPGVEPWAKKIREQGALVDGAEAIKKVVSIPVIAVGRLNPQLAEKALEEGKADLIAFARRLIADPEFPHKIAEGRVEDITPCMGCIGCMDDFIKGRRERCRVNPVFGNEQEFVLKPADKKKKVMVVGGGPAGMEAARIAALRGHQVTLYESGNKLGGMLPLAALIKGTEIEGLPDLVRYYRTQLSKLDVKVELGKEVTPAMVETVKPDAVILAVGGIVTTLQIPGIDSGKVLTGADLHHRVKIPLRLLGPVLLGKLTKFWLPVGKNVVIVGGLMHGCEVAEFLVKRGRKVTIVETSDELGTGIPDVNRVRLLAWFERKGVKMLSGARYKEITAKGLSITTREGETMALTADTIVVTAPPEPNTILLDALKGMVPEVYLIGDGKEPRLIVDATFEGSKIARAI